MRQEKATFEYKGKARAMHGLVCDGGAHELADMIEKSSNPVMRAISRDALRKLRAGDLTNAAASDKLLDKLETPDLEADARVSTLRVVAGGVADVPAYLAGSPVAMRRRVRQPDRMPLTIVCDVGTSGGISESIIRRRGVAVLALVRKLEAQGYPVDLWLGIVAQDGAASLPTGIAVKVDSKPLDLARACWGLSDAQFQRDITFNVIAAVAGLERTWSTIWPWKDASPGWVDDVAMQRAAYAALLNADPANLLVVPPVFISEEKHFADDEKTLAWVNQRFAQACALVQTPQD